MRIKLQRLEALATALRKTKGEAPEALPLDSGRALPCTCQRVFDPLDSLFAIELVTLSYCFRVFIRGDEKAAPL